MGKVVVPYKGRKATASQCVGAELQKILRTDGREVHSLSDTAQFCYLLSGKRRGSLYPSTTDGTHGFADDQEVHRNIGQVVGGVPPEL